MRKLMITAFLLIFILSGCLPNFEQQDEVIQENENNEEETAIVPKYQISDSYYRTLTPFKPSGSRGTVVSRLNTRYDSDEFEEGLLRIAQETFSTDKYIFQEGQYLDQETVLNWLKRKLTDDQLAKLEEDSNKVLNLGLNPPLEGSTKESYEKSPQYLSYILEHNYLTKTDENTVRISGLAIGLALNPINSYTVDGVSYNDQIPDDKLLEEGKKIAEQVVIRLRQIDGLDSIPITVGLFKQTAETSVIPGNYIAIGTVKSGTSLQWNNLNEKYVLFPSSNAQNNYRDDFSNFDLFQSEVNDYFPNYNGIVGRAFYVNDELNVLSIDINMQFYGKAEVIGFSQYIAGLIVDHFPQHWATEVNIVSSSGQEALIIKEPDMDEPFVHIY